MSDEYLNYTPTVSPDCGSAGGPQGYGCFGPAVATVPEPGTLPLLLAGLLVLRKLRQNRSTINRSKQDG